MRSPARTAALRTVAGVTTRAGTGQRPGGAVSLRLRELGAFGVVGLSCFVLDVGLFQVLYTQVGTGAVTAKLLATLVSTTAAYVGHRLWSFSSRPRARVGRSYALFAAVNAVTLLQGLAIVALVRHPLGQDSALVLQAANIGSIALGTVIRYLSYRRWVFPEHQPSAPPAPEAAEPGRSARTGLPAGG